MTQPDVRVFMHGSNPPAFSRSWRWALLLCLVHLLGCHGSVTVLPTSAGRLGTVRLFRPQHPSSGFVFLFSDAAGWTPQLEEAARQLAERDAVVAGVDLPQYLRGLAASDDGCHYLISEIEDMSERLQRDLGFPHYRSPILVGIGEGGMLAYAALAQSPNVTVGGAISIEPVRALHTKVPLCAGATPTALPGGGFTYAGRPGLPGWWHVVVPQPEPSWLRAAMDVAGAVQIPNDPTQSATEQIVATVGPTLAGPQTAQPSQLADLPLVEIDAEHPGDLMAVIYSGDGGWRDIDKQIGEVLAQRGVPVVGVDSLRYFWKEKTPEETARDLDAILQHYMSAWNTHHVILIGYSFGAGILPFAVNRLPSRTRLHVVLTALLGIESRADFEIALTAWLGASPRKTAPPTLPEVLRLDPTRVQCFFGEEEEDTLCRNPQLDQVERIETKGGHHFDEDYAALAARILDGARKRLSKQAED